MTIPVQQIVLAAIGLLLMFGSYIQHARIDQLRESIPKIHRRMFLPQGEVLRVVSLGYHGVVADFIWLQAIQAMGEKNVSEETGRWIHRALDVVTTLDPKFVQAYETGGLALCTLVVLPKESNALLEKGMKYNPAIWQLPFYAGINYYFELRDDAKAAEYIARAARLPGAPTLLLGLAARLYMSAKEPENAIELLASIYEQATDGEMRQVLEQRLKQAIIERDLQLLEKAIGRYRDRFSSQPDQLEDLVAQGILSALPRDPFGGRYQYDSQTGVVNSSSVQERMTMKGNRRQQ